MSQENVAIVRGFYEALNRRDLDEAVRHMHPEIELRPGIVAPDQRSHYHGHDEVKQFFETIYGAFEEQRVEFEEIVETDDRVLIVERWRMRGRDGIKVDVEVIDVYTFREGLIGRADGFLDKADALEAAGMSE